MARAEWVNELGRNMYVYIPFAQGAQEVALAPTGPALPAGHSEYCETHDTHTLKLSICSHSSLSLSLSLDRSLSAHAATSQVLEGPV
jgi:hypothetical protein